MCRKEKGMTKTSKTHSPSGLTAQDADRLQRMESGWQRLLEGGETGAFDPEWLQNLTEDFDGQTDLAEKLIKKILSQADYSALRLLTALNDRVATKGARKLVKRGLYLLQQKGLSAAPEGDQKPKPDSPSILKEILPAKPQGYLSEFDESGHRVAAMLIPNGLQGRVFFFVLITPSGEMESLSALEVNKKQARMILEDLEEQSGQAFLEAAPEQVGYLLKEAHDRGSRLSKSDEAQWTSIVNLLANSKSIGVSPIIRSIFAPGPDDSPNFPEMNRLLAIPEVARFPINPESLESYGRSIASVEEGVLVLSQEQKEGQIQNIVQKAAEEIFQGQGRERLTRYFEEVSYIYYLKGQEDQARVLFQAALSLNSPQESKINPLLIRLVEQVLFPGSHQPQADEAGPVMETTPGGIIVPPWGK
jgi:hypothetical protein